MNNYKHNATFYGHVSRKYYYCELKDEYEYSGLGIPLLLQPYIEETSFKEESEIFHKDVLTCFPFQTGDTVHISDLNLDVYIEKVIKNTNGSVDYYTSYVTRELEDKKTEESHQKALRDKSKYDKENVDYFNCLFKEETKAKEEVIEDEKEIKKEESMIDKLLNLLRIPRNRKDK